MIVPIALRNGGIANVEISRPGKGLDPRLVRIGIPKKASHVNAAMEPPIVSEPIDLNELFLPEEFFSSELLVKLMQSAD